MGKNCEKGNRLFMSHLNKWAALQENMFLCTRTTKALATFVLVQSDLTICYLFSKEYGIRC